MNMKNIIERIKPLFFDGSRHLVRPVVLQFPVIDICNSKCQMCRIWENKKSVDISVEQLKKGIQNELFKDVMSIGFNGGEPTLREDLSEVIETCLYSLPKLKQISLITNGFKYDQVIHQIEKIGKLIKSKDIFFDVMVSLDGFGVIHDKVRGRTGSFKHAQHVLTFLKNADYVSNIRIGCTVIKENVYYLHELLEFCIREKLYVKYRQGVPHKRLYTENLIEPYSLTFEEKYEFVEFLEGIIKYYEPSLLQKHFYRSLINQIIYEHPRTAGCDWRYRGATITAKGELAYCAIESKTLMKDISDGNAYQIYFDNENHLNDIKENKCKNCHHDYVGLPPPAEYRKIFLSSINEKWKIKDKIKKIPGGRGINKIINEYKYSTCINQYRNIHSTQVQDVSLRGNTRVLICGWYGTETLGDKAIIGGIINSVRSSLGYEVVFYIASLYPYITEMTRRQMPELKNCQIVNIQQAILLAKDMTYVVFGGGPLMAIDDIAPMQVIFEKAKQAKVKTGIMGCGIGPLGDKRYNNSIKTILELSDFRIYRDQKSKSEALRLGVNAENDIVAEDPAFSWIKSYYEQSVVGGRHRKAYINDEKEILLLGLRDFPWREYAKHLSEKECLSIKDNFEEVLVSALKEVVKKRDNLIIRPLPMCTNHFGSDDRWFYRRLFRDSGIPSENLDFSLCGRELAPTEYCKAFLDANALLAMRFHSLVFGLGLGTPSLALDYTLGKGKVKSLAERFGANVISLSKINKEELLLEIEDLLEHNSQESNVSILESIKFQQSVDTFMKRD